MGGLSICRVTNALYPDVIGGHAIFCDELSGKQADSGHQVEVFTARRRELPKRQSVKEGYQITRLEPVWMPWNLVRMPNPVTPALYSAVCGSNWDLIDAHSHLFWMTAVAVRAARDAGKPVITTIHGLLALRDWLTNLAQKVYLLSVGVWALRNSSRVVCLTESEAREVANIGVHSRKIRVIPVGIDPNAFRPRGPKRRTIVWVGRLVAEKDLATLVKAVAILRDKNTPNVVIVGDGPLRNKIMALARLLGLSNLIAFRLRASRSEVADILRESSILVISSLKEGLPMVLLEAMASGNTVVASNLPSIVEALGDAGLYFTPGNATELANALQDALTDEQLRRTKGKLAREIVIKKFGWPTVLPMLEALYAEVVGQ